MIHPKGNPGSEEAARNGCICPVLDNNHGKGGVYAKPDAFWINGNCPIHGLSDKQATFSDKDKA